MAEVGAAAAAPPGDDLGDRRAGLGATPAARTHSRPGAVGRPGGRVGRVGGRARADRPPGRRDRSRPRQRPRRGSRSTTDGTLRLVGGGVELAGVGRIVDGGEAGDSYNYGPPAERCPRRAPARRGDRGRARRAASRRDRRHARRYDWPRGLAADAQGRDASTVRTDGPPAPRDPSRRAVRARPDRRSTTRRAITACGSMSRCRRASRAPRPRGSSRSSIGA